MRVRIDQESGKRRLLMPGLILLAIVQGAAIASAVSRGAPPPVVRPPDLLTGQTISGLEGRDLLAGVASVSLRRRDGGWTVLMAFSPTCAWCDSVAPRWKRWTERVPLPLHPVGIAAGDPAAAFRYARAHHWKLEALLVVDSALTGVQGIQLTRKTPWLFLFDSTGTLRYSGHGNDLSAVELLAGVSR